jgi:hypothetical protein
MESTVLKTIYSVKNKFAYQYPGRTPMIQTPFSYMDSLQSDARHVLHSRIKMEVFDDEERRCGICWKGNVVTEHELMS